MKIRTKLLISVLLTVSIVIAGIEYLNYTTTRNVLEDEIHERAMNMLAANTYELDGRIKDMQEIAEGLKTSLESVPSISEGGLKGLIQNFLTIHPDAYGSAIAFEPGTFGESPGLAAQYYYRTSSGFEFSDLARPEYNYPEWDWYKIPVKTTRPLWIGPYQDSGGGGITMMTFATPFFKDKKVWGVATVDVAISKLINLVDNIKVGRTGFAYLIGADGTFLSKKHGDPAAVTIFDAAKELKSPDLEDLGNSMVAGRTGFVSFASPFDGMISWFAYAPVPTTGWSLAIVLPESELMAEITALHNRVIFLSIMGLLLVFGIIFFISGKVSSPIRALSQAAYAITKGNFSVKLPEQASNDEVGVLTSAFKEMSVSLQDAIEHIREEKEMSKVALSHITEGVVILNARWNVLQSNPAAEKFLRFPIKGTLLEHLEQLFGSTVPFAEFMNLSRERASFDLNPKDGGKGISCSLAPLYGEDHKLKERILIIAERS